MIMYIYLYTESIFSLCHGLIVILGWVFSTGSTIQRLSLRLLLCPHRRQRQLGSVLARSGKFGVIIFWLVPPDVHGRGAVLGRRARGVGHLSVLLV